MSQVPRFASELTGLWPRWAAGPLELPPCDTHGNQSPDRCASVRRVQRRLTCSGCAKSECSRRCGPGRQGYKRERPAISAEAAARRRSRRDLSARAAGFGCPGHTRRAATSVSLRRRSRWLEDTRLAPTCHPGVSCPHRAQRRYSRRGSKCSSTRWPLNPQTA
jgi:hypothetical protein